MRGLWASGIVGLTIAACGRIGFDGSGDATSDDARIGGDDATPQTLGCAGQSVTQSYTFATDTEGWTFKPNTGYMATLAWTDLLGEPEPGSLALSISGSGTAPVGWLMAPGSFDLRGRVISAWVRTPNSGVVAKIYGMNLPGNAWSDGGAHSLSPNVWQCVTFDVDSPGFRDPAFDPGNVRELGLHLDITAPSSVAVDQWQL